MDASRTWHEPKMLRALRGAAFTVARRGAPVVAVSLAVVSLRSPALAMPGKKHKRARTMLDFMPTERDEVDETIDQLMAEAIGEHEEEEEDAAPGPVIEPGMAVTHIDFGPGTVLEVRAHAVAPVALFKIYPYFKICNKQKTMQHTERNLRKMVHL